MKCKKDFHPYKVLCASALALLVGGCASAASEPRSSVPAPVSQLKPLPGAIPPSLYQEEVGSYRLGGLQRNERNGGYTVESSELLDARNMGAVGSLVVVRSSLNAVTAIIDRPGKRGLLLIDEAGKRRFIDEPAYDYMQLDALPDEAPSAGASGEATNAGHEIDALVTFSTKALAVLDADPVAFALAQLETANMGLRNSRVPDVHVNLAGVIVTETDHGVDGPGLSATQSFMNALRSSYQHDINVAYYDRSPYAGMAYMPGNSSVNGIRHPMAFRHELGHNAGGGHCHPEIGDNYKHGYHAPRGARTHLCGNDVPYYSTPSVTFNEEPLGNALTADMARLWREQAARLSGYSPAFQGERMIYLSTQRESELKISTSPTSNRGGVVALTPQVGPVQLSGASGEYTLLRVPLQAENGETYTVNLRAQSQNGDCPRTIMNSSMGCHPDRWRGSFSLILSYDVEQNLHLPEGWYNGALELKALDPGVPDWSRPILVSLSLRR